MKEAAEELIEEMLEDYNQTVNDMAKFKLNDREVKLFANAMEHHAKQQAIGFLDFVNKEWTKVKSEELKTWAWVNYKENEVLLHGSDWHITTLINEVGITTDQLYTLYQTQKPKTNG